MGCDLPSGIGMPFPVCFAQPLLHSGCRDPRSLLFIVTQQFPGVKTRLGEVFLNILRETCIHGLVFGEREMYHINYLCSFAFFALSGIAVRRHLSRRERQVLALPLGELSPKVTERASLFYGGSHDSIPLYIQAPVHPAAAGRAAAAADRRAGSQRDHRSGRYADGLLGR